MKCKIYHRDFTLLVLCVLFMFKFDLIAKAMEKEPNKFLLVHLLSKRMHQLVDGATPLSSKTYNAEINTALQEFLDDTIRFGEEGSESETEEIE